MDVFAGLVIVTNTQTDHTACNNCSNSLIVLLMMWRKLLID